jgi:hypothetical protein
MRLLLTVTMALVTTVAPAIAAENLKLNPNLDYTSDSQDGPLITGDRMEAGVVAGKPAYIILYGEACYNSKRQARRTVSLYDKYKGQVQFLVIDLDRDLSRSQRELREKYYRGNIPHVVVLDRSGVVLYNSAGEVEEKLISSLLDKALR